MSLAEPSAEESHAFISYLRGLPDVPDLVRFFDRGGYFTVHQRDAVSVAQEYYKTNAVIKYMHVRGARPGADPREGGTPYVSVSRAMTTTILRSLLLERRKRVEVYRLSGREWALARRGSPGNLSAFEDELLRDASVPATSVTLAVRLGPPVPSGQRRLGVALADPTQRWLRVVELGDDDQFSALESLAVQHGARECVIASDTAGAERAKLDEAMQRCEVCLTEAKRATFAGKDADADLARLSGQPAGAALPDGVRDSALCRGAASAIIAYLDVMADTASHAQWQLGTADLEQFMRLDAGAVRALSVEPAADERAREASLVGLLNRCRTPMGTRLLRARLHQPLRSAYDIERRLDLVQVFVDDALLRAQLQGSLLGKGIPDLERLGRRFGAGKAGLPELWRAYQFTERLPDLTKALDDLVAAGGRGSELVGEKYAAPLRTAGADFVKLQQLVRASISLEAAAQGEYLIQPRYDPELTELYAEKEAAMGGLQEHVGSVAAALGFRGKDAERVKLVADVGTGLQLLRVTRKDEPVLRDKPGYAVLTTRKDGVTFTAPGTRALATRWDAATRAYREKQAALVAKVLQVAGTFAPVLAACAGVLADLDVSVALAVAAVSAPTPYVRPTILPPTEPRRIVLKGCRHPCMEAISAGGAFIPNDVALEHGASHFQIVTGPNMGGKSTYIRAAGISVLLAHAGSFVPCDEAAISLTDAILARVGAGDCQARGLSTFMAEMLETATIIRCASEHSLVLIDELGRGTSTYDGYGLAWAISEHLATRVRCSALFATHFHELTELGQVHPAGVTNRHVSAHVQDGKMAMLFQVRDGPCDQSFGIHVAELARFPPEVIAAAKRKAAELEDFGDGGGADASGRRARARLPGGAADADGGEAAVRDFLAQFAQLPLEGASAEAAGDRVCELLAKLKAEHGGEEYVAGVLA